MPRQSCQHRVKLLYTSLFKYYGPQGWWPLISTTSVSDQSGYHKDSYEYPKWEFQQLEICLGALLTQNTSWINASRALSSLYQVSKFDLNKIIQLSIHELELAIKPAGYFRQKAVYIVEFLEFINTHSFVSIEKMSLLEARSSLLSIKGIGPETADCMLLYAFRKCSFVVDAYTTRILDYLNIISQKTSYQEIKELIENALPHELNLYQEFHALLVGHGKEFFSKKPYGMDDPVLNKETFEN